MKLKLLIIAALSFTTGIANSAPGEADTTVSVTRKDSSATYLLNYTGTKTGKVIVTVKDDNGATLIARAVSDKKDFLLPVNFSAVGEGVYTIQVDNGAAKETRTIHYNNDTNPTYSHVIGLGNSRYLVTTSHAGTETISIRIYDGAGNLVFNGQRVIHGNLAVLFNLKDVAGKPSFEVSENSGHSLVIVQ